MNIDTPDTEPELRLDFYWYEVKPEEEANVHSGELAGGISRLASIRDELESLRTKRNVEKALELLQSQFEGYLFCAYTIREHAIALLALRANQPHKKGQIKKQKTRDKTMSDLRLACPELTTAVDNLLRLLDGDVGLRNILTHEQSLGLGLFTSSGAYDPIDVLSDLSIEPSRCKEFERLLRREIKKTSQHYAEKVQVLLEAVENVRAADLPFLVKTNWSRSEATS